MTEQRGHRIPAWRHLYGHAAFTVAGAAGSADDERYGEFQAAAMAAQHAEAASADALAAVARGRGMMEEEDHTSSQLADLAAALDSLPTEMSRDNGAAWEVVRQHLQRSGEGGPGVGQSQTGAAGYVVLLSEAACPCAFRRSGRGSVQDMHFNSSEWPNPAVHNLPRSSAPL